MSPLLLQRQATRLLIAAALLAAVGYGIFEARRLLEGPQLSITYPRDGSAVAGPAVTLTGTAQNVAFLSVNDAQAYADADGRFMQTLSPADGYAVFEVAARDRFGRTASKTVRVSVLDYCPVDA